MRDKKIFIIGGAGFIGSHFVDRLLADNGTQQVSIYDNFSSGKHWHFEHHQVDKRFKVFRAEVHDLQKLCEAMAGHKLVIHLASNPDIAKAMTDPDIDFRQGTELTRNVVEAMRITKTKRILYASGSGVFGDIGEIEADENYGPLIPISTYGASKLAGEALIASYCHMFDLIGCAFRFGNVVGQRQSHGVGLDFIQRLMRNTTTLRILGDGNQSKSYIHVEDVVAAVLLANEKSERVFSVYNVATGDYITVNEIAGIACSCLGLKPKEVNYEHTAGDRGWKGDVPVVRLSIKKILSLGWKPKYNSAEAIRSSIVAMLKDLQHGLEH
jgi:UDP-glucose 4-epimerase